MARPYLIFNVIFVIGCYNELKVVRRPILCQLLKNKIDQITLFLLYQSILNTHGIKYIKCFKSKLWLYCGTNFQKINKQAWCLRLQEGNQVGRFCTSIRRGYVLPWPHTEISTKKIIWLHETVIILMELQTFLK